MNRRDFLSRLAACGLVAATPKIIFDLGKNSHLYKINEEFWEVDIESANRYSCGRLDVCYSDEAVKLLTEYEINQAFLKARPILPLWMYEAAYKMNRA